MMTAEHASAFHRDITAAPNGAAMLAVLVKAFPAFDPIHEITRPHLIAALEFAKSVDALEALVSKLAFLGDYAGGAEKGIRVRLCKDSTYSFGFDIMKDGNTWFFGGLIYDGPGHPCDASAPAFTVSIGRREAVHNWGIHT